MDINSILGYIGALIVGLVLGLIGGGGSILTVPVLVYLIGINPVTATAYSLFVVGITSTFGTIQNFKAKLVDIRIAIIFSLPALIAVYLTRRFIVPAIPDVVLSSDTFQISKNTFIMVFFAIIMLLASISMIKKRKVKQTPLSVKTYNYLLIGIEGIVVGLLTGLVGAGGGFLIIPALVILTKLPMKKAIGTSLLIIATKSLIGFLGDLHNLSIDWWFLIIFTSLSIVGIIIGVYLSKFISSKKLKSGFGWFTLVMSFYIIYRELF